ncbi:MULTISPECIES: hypothetical protein [Apilactobacillus]|nr:MULTISPECIES: hypothetical protein [Apilactobacillus]
MIKNLNLNSNKYALPLGVYKDGKGNVFIDSFNNYITDSIKVELPPT